MGYGFQRQGQIGWFPAPEKINVKQSAGNGKFTFNRWGRSGLNAMGFAIFPAGTDAQQSPATVSVCVSSGWRIRALPAAKCS